MPSILETYEAMHGKSKAMAARAAKVFPSGVTHDARAFSPFPIYVDRAAGPRKWDIDGNEYVDYIGGHGALLLGHNRAEVMDAARAAMERGTHFGSSHEWEILWGQQVIDMVPCAEKVRFTASGTEATMMALRLARAFTGRDRVIKLVDHFHGWNDVLVGQVRDDDPMPFSVGVPAAFYSTLSVLPSGDVTALEEALKARDVAAVILEPTGAHWGSHPLAPSYLREARRLTEETGTLFIMDEVITGFRMAPGGAQEAYDVTPDLSTHAKILAGGFPGGGVVGRADIMDFIELRDGDADWNQKRRISHQGTFNAKFREESVPGSAWAVSSMWHTNLGYDAPVPVDVEWDAIEEPRGIEAALLRPLRWSLYNHGVDLMGTGGMVSSTHGDAEVERTISAFRTSIGDLRSEGLLA
jgi:glutamate-1-semialdehyde 2,1-aminomutase